MSAHLRRIGLLATVVAAAIVIAWIVLMSPLAIGALPRVRGTVQIADERLGAPVTVRRNSRGVPMIAARTRNDAYFAQGYVHAQDRFFQMEIARRTGNGTLAELLGEPAMNSDIYFRTLGLARVAQAEYEVAPEWAQSALEAYAAGVTAYVESRPVWRLGYEFLLLALTGRHVAIASWIPADSLVWGKVMGHSLAGNYQNELLRLEIARSVGFARTDDLFPDPLAHGMPSTVKEAELAVVAPHLGHEPETTLIGDTAAALLASPRGGFAGVLNWSVSSPFARSGPAGAGSNAWVVAGEHTDSGAPLLANDPHLTSQIPSVFYELGLSYTQDGRDVNVSGHSFPGVPGVVIGRNDHVAWGLTTAYVDEQDLFVEELNPDDPSLYRTGDGWAELDVRTEAILVAGRSAPVEVQVAETRNGPLISRTPLFADHASALPQGGDTRVALYELALGWVALQPGSAFPSMVALTEAQNATQVRDALRGWSGPAHNVVYADSDGTIGYQLAAVVPDRQGRSGAYPALGWRDADRWAGTIPFDRLPHVENPDRGYIVSANNAWGPASAIRDLGHDYLPGYRARRIEALLTSALDAGPVTPQTMKEIQLDVYDEAAGTIIDSVRELDLPAAVGAQARAARELLLSWDRIMRPESAGAALYARFLVRLTFAILEDEFPPELWNEGELLAPFARIVLATERLLASPSSPWWDDRRTTTFVERRDQILTGALQDAYLDLESAQGERPNAWTWDASHDLVLRHPAFGESGSRLLDRIFGRGPYSTPAGTNQVNRFAVTLGNTDEVAVASAFRVIQDLSNGAPARVSPSTGQSGHIASRRYDDAIEGWIAGEYVTGTHPGDARSGASELVLEPRGTGR